MRPPECSRLSWPRGCNDRYTKPDLDKKSTPKKKNMSVHFFGDCQELHMEMRNPEKHTYTPALKWTAKVSAENYIGLFFPKKGKDRLPFLSFLMGFITLYVVFEGEYLSSASVQYTPLHFTDSWMFKPHPWMMVQVWGLLCSNKTGWSIILKTK